MKKPTSARKGSSLARAEGIVRTYGLSFPEAYEEFPWGDRALKVNKKMFICMGCSAEALTFSVKLPHTGREVLLQPGFEPTGYGLGKSGWVSGRFAEGDAIPLPWIQRMIEESYRAIAPKRLVALLGQTAERTPRKKA